jgi:hypothetical protein
MQVCGICGAWEENGNISLDRDRAIGRNISDRDVFFTQCCQRAIAAGKKGCLNKKGKALDLPYLQAQVRPIV